MPQKSFLTVFAIVLLCLSPAAVLNAADDSDLFSSSVAQILHTTAYELANADNVTAAEAEQALVLLKAAGRLDRNTEYLLGDMLRLTCQYYDTDYSELILKILRSYIDESCDLELAEQAIGYIIQQKDSREQREEIIKNLLDGPAKRNKLLQSELLTLLGALMAEKTDFESALTYFAQAYEMNKYNRLAFEKLAELMSEQIEPAIYLEHLRRKLGENPLDMQAAMAFAGYAANTHLYQTAADTYEYCTELFGFLYPDAPLPSGIYLPWALSSYHSQRSRKQPLQIAQKIRQSGKFDLLLEVVAARATAKIGNTEQAEQILKAAEKKALQLIEQQQTQQINYKQLAWFYCFAIDDANSAIDWANKAYSAEPNSAEAASVLAYSLVLNNQPEMAKSLIDNYEHNQLCSLALAKIQILEEQTETAVETLKSTIAVNPLSLEAEQAKYILARQGQEYIPPTDANIILTTLKNSFGQGIVPEFAEPEQIIDFELNVRGTKFSYTGRFGGSVSITNNSSEPLVISDYGLFRGNIRIDAVISGDLEGEFPNLVVRKIKPSKPIEPGRSILVPVRLYSGELRKMLLNHPQASVNVKFSAYLDPETDAAGKLTGSLMAGKPADVTISRPAVELNRKYLQNRLSSLAEGKQGQKIQTARLFIGLVVEQQQMVNRQLPYAFKYADWMPVMLKSAIVYSLDKEDWVVKTHIMVRMLPLKLDYDLINAVARNLNDSQWPVRLMAVLLLGRSQNEGFKEVLDWYAEYDPDEFVRNIATALGGTKPQPQKSQSQP